VSSREKSRRSPQIVTMAPALPNDPMTTVALRRRCYRSAALSHDMHGQAGSISSPPTAICSPPWSKLGWVIYTAPLPPALPLFFFSYKSFHSGSHSAKPRVCSLPKGFQSAAFFLQSLESAGGPLSLLNVHWHCVARIALPRADANKPFSSIAFGFG